MGAAETIPSRKMPIRILGVFYSQRSTLFTSSNHGVRERMTDRKKAGRKRSAFLALIIF